MPSSWFKVIPDDLADLEKRFGESSESKAPRIGVLESSADGEVFYIVKPDHLCQGRGIFLTTELERRGLGRAAKST